jgi:hypothetical protein
MCDEDVVALCDQVMKPSIHWGLNDFLKELDRRTTERNNQAIVELTRATVWLTGVIGVLTLAGVVVAVLALL